MTIGIDIDDTMTSSSELIKITSVKSGVKIDKIVQYILVDTRTLYKNP